MREVSSCLIRSKSNSLIDHGLAVPCALFSLSFLSRLSSLSRFNLPQPRFASPLLPFLPVAGRSFRSFVLLLLSPSYSFLRLRRLRKSSTRDVLNRFSVNVVRFDGPAWFMIYDKLRWVLHRFPCSFQLVFPDSPPSPVVNASDELSVSFD